MKDIFDQDRVVKISFDKNYSFEINKNKWIVQLLNDNNTAIINSQ